MYNENFDSTRERHGHDRECDSVIPVSPQLVQGGEQIETAQASSYVATSTVCPHDCISDDAFWGPHLDNSAWLDASSCVNYATSEAVLPTWDLDFSFLQPSALDVGTLCSRTQQGSSEAISHDFSWLGLEYFNDAASSCSSREVSDKSLWRCHSPHAQELVTHSRHDDSGTREESRHICESCCSRFRRPGDLRRHMRKHKALTHSCVVEGCSRGFYRMDKLRDHIRQAHKDYVVSTDEGSREGNAAEEAETRQPGSSFVCVDCGEEFTTAGRRQKHINRKHVRRFTCDTCDTAFHLNADLKRHQITVHGSDVGQTFSCPYRGCTQTFSRRDNLLRHESRCRHK